MNILSIQDRSATFPDKQTYRGRGNKPLFIDDFGRLLTTTSPNNAPADAVDNASDKAVTITYLDAGTCNERINTVVTSSASLGLSYTDTYAYQLTNGEYQLTGVARS
jgi:hypothetical protein